MHLEARYDYEALETGSAWVGYKLSGGERIAWDFIPMIGGVLPGASRPATEGRSLVEARVLQRG